MHRVARIVVDLNRLLALFAPHCSDRETLDELVRMVSDHTVWPKAHDLFQRIRRKTLDAERERDRALAAQYLFEEVCAKTLYNVSQSPAPFDADSPYWIVPNAFAFARALRMDDSRVLEIVAA